MELIGYSSGTESSNACPAELQCSAPRTRPWVKTMSKQKWIKSSKQISSSSFVKQILPSTYLCAQPESTRREQESGHARSQQTKGNRGIQTQRLKGAGQKHKEHNTHLKGVRLNRIIGAELVTTRNIQRYRIEQALQMHH